MAETFTKGSFPSCRRRTVCARRMPERQRKGRRYRPQVRWTTTANATDRSKDQAKPAAAAAQALRMALVGLERRNIQIAFEIDQDKDQVRHVALEDKSSASAGKDLPTRSRRCKTQATDRSAENVQTRYTAPVNALNAEAKRINAMPQDGERDRALTAYIKKEYEKLNRWRKSWPGIEGKRNDDTRNATNRIRQQIKEMEDGYKAVWRGLDDYVNSLVDAQAERAPELVADRPHEGGSWTGSPSRHGQSAR